MVRVDEGYYFFVVDCIKNMYIFGGENVYLVEVEWVLQVYLLVVEVVVIGVLDEKWGEAGWVFVVLYVIGKVGEVEILCVYCKVYLAKFKVLWDIVFLDELFKNDIGKINWVVLKGQQSR